MPFGELRQRVAGSLRCENAIGITCEFALSDAERNISCSIVPELNQSTSVVREHIRCSRDARILVIVKIAEEKP